MTDPRSPNFLVVGAQKSGTSYLCAALARHPDVFFTKVKEPLFFQQPDVGAADFARYLRTHFAAAGTQPWAGEGSTVTLQWPHALANVRRFLGDDIRAIACLRQPTDRAVSFYLHNLRKGRFDGSERLAGAGGDDTRLSHVHSGRYADALERWLEAYGANVHVLLFDDLVADPGAFVRGATDALGLAPATALPATAVNRGQVLAWDGEVLSVPGAPRPRFTRVELEDAHAMFLDDIARTEALLGRSLAAWRALPDFTARQAGF